MTKLLFRQLMIETVPVKIIGEINEPETMLSTKVLLLGA